MLTDAHVRRSVDAVKAPLLASKWGFKPASDDPIDLEVARFCEWVFFECLDWAESLEKITTYIEFGFSVLEYTDDTAPVPTSRFPNHPGNGIGVVLSGLHDRPQWSICEWHPVEDDHSRLSHVVQWDADELKLIESDRLVRFTWEQRGSNFGGMALLRSAWGPWKGKLTCRVLELIRHERIAVGTPTITLPGEGEDIEVSDDDIANAETILKSLRSAHQGYAVLPGGYKLDWAEGGEPTDLDATIKSLEQDIAHNLGTSFLLLGQQGGAGSYNLAGTLEGQFHLSIHRHANKITGGFNRGSDGHSLVERIVRLNYGDRVALPSMIAKNLPTKPIDTLLRLTKELAEVGALTPDDQTEADIREDLDLRPRDPSVPRRYSTMTEPQTPPEELLNDA